MVPGLVGRMVELLESIDRKMDRVLELLAAEDDTPELLDIDGLIKYLPSHPAKKTVYDWCTNRSIPFYKQGKRTVFRKSEIDAWLLRSRRKDQAEMMEEAREYVANHPIGGWKR